MDQIELFTDAEAAKILRLSKVSLWRRRQAREISFRRDNGKILYLREDLERYVSRNHQLAIGKTTGRESESYGALGSRANRSVVRGCTDLESKNRPSGTHCMTEPEEVQDDGQK